MEGASECFPGHRRRGWCCFLLLLVALFCFLGAFVERPATQSHTYGTRSVIRLKTSRRVSFKASVVQLAQLYKVCIWDTIQCTHAPLYTEKALRPSFKAKGDVVALAILPPWLTHRSHARTGRRTLSGQAEVGPSMLMRAEAHNRARARLPSMVPQQM